MSNQAAKYSAPGIVVGGGLNALGVVRSLGQAGVPLVVMDTDPKSPAMRSRFGSKRLVKSLEGEGFITDLNRVAAEHGTSAVLFLTEEKTVNTVSAHRQELSPALKIRLPEHQRLMALMHKQGFQDLAEAISAPVPPTVRLQSSADLPKLASLTYPCVLKPSEKSYEYGALFKKAYKVASPAEVAQLYRKIEPVLADMVVQEWIEGVDSEIYFCLQYIGRGCEVVGSFAGRKLRSWPPRIGGTASCTAAWEHADELARLTADFFRQVSFFGMGSMEYKRDQRDGRFYMVEPTVGRTDFQEEVATVNGCNLPLLAYRYELGLPLPLVKAVEPPRIWRDAQIERWSVQESGDPPDTKSASHAKTDAYWRWNDPRPALAHYAQRILDALDKKTS
ncbi:carboxylate--amine ligase [Rhodoferax antarcticus]|uniref:carboxylate--amine ligase n=1 Tax=Rhodoferax antarcticus TaxID=81479 RepID=UPI0022250E10|nr:carboxylate--amine ligase [Rhodoferax antarcticus]MCW2314376.1 putative ATP-grasp superfamily ATP-dependent carboligase [Rhodoferax antarcticus]